MKNRRLTHHYEEARIYRHYYKPSLNLFRLFRSVMSVFFTGTAAAASGYHRKK